MVLYGFVWYIMVKWDPQRLGLPQRKTPLDIKWCQWKTNQQPKKKLDFKTVKIPIFEAYLHEDLKYLEIPGGVE